MVISRQTAGVSWAWWSGKAGEETGGVERGKAFPGKTTSELRPLQTKVGEADHGREEAVWGLEIGLRR